MNKIIWVIIVVLVIFGGYSLLVKDAAAPEPAPVATPEPVAPASSAAPVTTTIVNTVTAPVITYLDNGFTPARLVVKRGTEVTFQNGSISGTWPASDIHPTHTAYPTTGGCLGSTFDACGELKPGESWSFRFDVVGTWNYHDHRHPQHRGVVVVE